MPLALARAAPFGTDIPSRPHPDEVRPALITRYATRFTAALAAVDAESTDASSKLAAYAGLYLDVLRNERMCLCGMLAAEYQTLPEQMQRAVVRFFDDNETWLQVVLEQGRRDGTLHFATSAREAARMIIAGPRRGNARRPPPRRSRPVPSAIDQLLAEVIDTTLGASGLVATAVTSPVAPRTGQG